MKRSLPAGSERQQTKQTQPVADAVYSENALSFVDNRPEALAQRKLRETINASPKMLAQRKLAEAMNNSPRMVAQRKLHASMNRPAKQLQAAPEEEFLQGKFEAVQRIEEEEPLQGKFAPQSPAQLEQQPVTKPNNTGLPDNLKSGIESLSGMSMDNVNVHYNSSQPAQLNALAYAQGTDIHVAPGQEQHLPHEAWHVVQQAQGRVQPTMQMKDGVSVNDDAGLEHEADVMGRALTSAAQRRDEPEAYPSQGKLATVKQTKTIQRLMDISTFKQSTDLGLNRVSIVEIDNKLEVYHKFKEKNSERLYFGYVSEEQEETHKKEVELLNSLKKEIQRYIDEKGPNHVRVPPVQRLLDDVNYTLGYHDRKLQTPEEVKGMIENNPDQNNTVNLLLETAYAPSVIPEVKKYFTKAENTYKALLMAGLAEKEYLKYYLDGNFIDNEGITTIQLFPKGKNLSIPQCQAIDEFVTKVTTLSTMKELFSQRFDIDKDKIKGLEVGKPTAGDDKIKAEVDWDLAGLKQAYNVMKMLPDGHAASNTSLNNFKRFQGGGGWYGDNNTVSIGYDNLNSKSGDKRTLGDRWRGEGQDVFMDKNNFDATVRHEVGHAVDAKHKFSDSYCIGNANGGDWKEYTGGLEMVQAYLTMSNSKLAQHEACVGVVKMEIAKLITGTDTVDNVKAAVIKHMTELSSRHAIEFKQDIVKNDAIFSDMQKANLKKPWNSSESKSIAGRTFVYSNDTKLSSYDSAARARQVSNYQFRAPAEWFAEAYAAYYQPNTSKPGHGEALRDRDRTTFAWFQNNVDKSL